MQRHSLRSRRRLCRLRLSKTRPAESFGGKDSVKGNRQGFLSRSNNPPQRQNCKIMLQNLILQFGKQLGEKGPKGLF